MKLVSPNFADLYQPNIEIGQFPDRDSHIRIPELSSYENRDVTVFHRLYPKQNTALIELFVIIDALKSIGARVTAVCPYLPYARQDKQTADGELTTASALARLFAGLGLMKLITFDCHFLNQEGEVNYHGLVIQNISMGDALIEHARTNFGGEAFQIIGPDAGANYLVKGAGGKSLSKVRKNYVQDKIAYRNIESLDGEFDVKDQNVLLLDDMISTGSTMLEALNKLRKNGAKKIMCAATHGLFLFDSLSKLGKLADFIFATDSITSLNSNISIKDKLAGLDSAAPTLL